jgi:ABC-type multidrug transport system fused ATPase/permease subunit
MKQDIKNHTSAEHNKIYNAGYALYITDTILVTIIGIALWNKENNANILLVDLGLLTFLGIFYTFVTSEIYQRKFNYISEVIEKRINDLQDSVVKSAENIKNLKSLEKEIKNIDERISNNKTVKYFLKLDYVFYISVLAYIISIILSLVELTQVSAIFLSIGITSTIHIVSAWLFVYQK